MNAALVVPIYQADFTPDEQVSLRHLKRFTYDYPCIVIRPEGLQVSLPNSLALDFSAEHFASASAFSRLLLSADFYASFADYNYILIYQLDCLLFSGDLQNWCELGYDFIGAPLFEKNRLPPRLSRVGNGGLSLRRVQAFLDVLESPRIPAWHRVLTTRLPDLYQHSARARWLRRARIIRDARRGADWYIQHYSLNEDLFWSDRARLFAPHFKIAPLDVGLQFAFDTYPSVCFEQNGRQLPFGAHAWAKFERDFWERFLIRN
jgi:hypothetical protein